MIDRLMLRRSLRQELAAGQGERVGRLLGLAVGKDAVIEETGEIAGVGVPHLVAHGNDLRHAGAEKRESGAGITRLLGHQRLDPGRLRSRLPWRRDAQLAFPQRRLQGRPVAEQGAREAGTQEYQLGDEAARLLEEIDQGGASQAIVPAVLPYQLQQVVMTVAAPMDDVKTTRVADRVPQGLPGDAVAEDLDQHMALGHHPIVEEVEELLPFEPHGERARPRRLGVDEEHPQRLAGRGRRRQGGRGRARRLHPHHQVALEEGLLPGRRPRDLPRHPRESRRQAILRRRRLPDEERPVMDARVERGEDLRPEDRLAQKDADLVEEILGRGRPIGEAHATGIGADIGAGVEKPLPKRRAVLGEDHLVRPQVAALPVAQAEAGDPGVRIDGNVEDEGTAGPLGHRGS